ncbi:MAG: SRPBCC family protein [Dehalococcoidia bacterium]|nr:MAG: SRPBCC family protein [Dehalococcoidia bacterium]
MRVAEMSMTVNAPREMVVREIADYARTRILSKGRHVQSCEVLEDDGTTSIALWRIKVLCFVFEAKNRQIVTMPESQTNEVLTGMARGTYETVIYSDSGKGTRIDYKLELRIPRFKLLEIPLIWFAIRMTRNLLMDDKRDIEAKYSGMKD